ncbi:hypothetical protein DFJ74DRAFT_305491 [Hyaloraphidium curvatum]|nr:hypothetical protein DFJ74DRAFT_305491 [Hyaloraphidium curvatum]
METRRGTQKSRTRLVGTVCQQSDAISAGGYLLPTTLFIRVPTADRCPRRYTAGRAIPALNVNQGLQSPVRGSAMSFLNPKKWFGKPKPDSKDPRTLALTTAKYNPKANPAPSPYAKADGISPEMVRAARIAQYYQDHPVDDDEHDTDHGVFPDEGMQHDERVVFLKRVFGVQLIDKWDGEEVDFIRGFKSLINDALYSRVHLRVSTWIFAIAFFVTFIDFLRTTWWTAKTTAHLTKLLARGLQWAGRGVYNAGAAAAEKTGLAAAASNARSKLPDFRPYLDSIPGMESARDGWTRIVGSDGAVGFWGRLTGGAKSVAPQGA